MSSTNVVTMFYPPSSLLAQHWTEPSLDIALCNPSSFILPMQEWKIMSLLEALPQQPPHTLKAMLS